MGLSANFKKFVQASLPSAVVSEEPSADVILLDAPCVMHSFSASEVDPIPGGEQLVRRILRAAVYGCGDTAVVCFDRHSETPNRKGLAHAKRRQAKRAWTREEVKKLLSSDMLPFGDEWVDLLANRDVRGLVAEYLRDRLLDWHASAEGRSRVRRLIIHNGGEEGGPVVSLAGERSQPTGAPRAGEADVAIAAWAVWFAREAPGTRLLVRTVDTDLSAILAVHAQSPCTIAFTHHDPKHRLCVDIDGLRQALQSSYGLSPREFVAVAIAKGTDFAEPSLRGLPDWHTTLRLCGSFARSQKLFDGSAFTFNNFARMLASAALHAKRAKVAELTGSHRSNVEFNIEYWTNIDTCFPSDEEGRGEAAAGGSAISVARGAADL